MSAIAVCTACRNRRGCMITIAIAPIPAAMRPVFRCVAKMPASRIPVRRSQRQLLLTVLRLEQRHERKGENHAEHEPELERVIHRPVDRRPSRRVDLVQVRRKRQVRKARREVVEGVELGSVLHDRRQGDERGEAEREPDEAADLGRPDRRSDDHEEDRIGGEQQELFRGQAELAQVGEDVGVEGDAADRAGEEDGNREMQRGDAHPGSCGVGGDDEGDEPDPADEDERGTVRRAHSR